MATSTRVTKVARNPGRGRYRLQRTRHKNARRKLSAKQIKYFGSARQRAALKAARKRKRGAAGRSKNTSRTRIKVIYKRRNTRSKRARRTRSSNPLVVTLGSVNPKRRRTSSMATKKRRRRRVKNAAPRRRRRRSVNRASYRRRRSNPRRVYAHAPVRRRRARRHNARHRRHNYRRLHRNPAIFGRSGGKDLLKMGAGVLAGVAITKMVPRYIPASIASSIGSGSIMAVVISAVSAYVTGFALSKIDPEFGQAAMLGGFAQTISVALNAFLPSVGGTFSLGDLVNGRFVVPQNPIMAGMGGGGVTGPVARGMASYPPAY